MIKIVFFVGNRCKIPREKIRTDGNIENFAIPLKGGFNDYFRVEITDENGYVAATNAYYGALDEE